MTIYVLVSMRGENQGHGGGYIEVPHLAMAGPYDTNPPHPAFLSEGSARQYLVGLGVGGFGLRPMALEVRA